MQNLQEDFDVIEEKQEIEEDKRNVNQDGISLELATSHGLAALLFHLLELKNNVRIEGAEQPQSWS